MFSVLARYAGVHIIIVLKGPLKIVHLITERNMEHIQQKTVICLFRDTLTTEFIVNNET
jgi:hypothetical protein